MSAEKPKNPKRRVVVRITARDKNDPASILNAVRNALSGHGIMLDVRTTGDEPPPESPFPLTHPSAEVVADEPLETAARELAQTVLDAEAAKADKEKATAERDSDRLREEVLAARRGTRAYIAFWFGQGVRITVEIYARTADVVVGVVSRILGGKGKGSE
jgi:hypothetical protein